MANKENSSNFKQAFGELLSGKIASEPTAEAKAVTKNTSEADVMAKVAAAVGNIEDHKIEYEETVIGKSVVIEGNVRSSAKLIVNGEVTGNVTSSSDLVVNGKIGGALQGNNIILNQCEINNTVNASGEIQVSQKSVVNGDVKADSVSCEGTVNGNINAQSVTLLSTSKTTGDITCKKIRIMEGAAIKGKLETN